MARALVILTIALICDLSAAAAAAAPGPLPRDILALYDSRYDKELGLVSIHQIAEMPLNHLGLVVRYHDINKPLPLLRTMTDVRGVITWFRSESMVDPRGFLQWASEALDAGKRFVVIGDIGAAFDLNRTPTPPAMLQAFWSRLGLRTSSRLTTITYDWAVSHVDARIFGFERRLEGVLPAFGDMQKIDRTVRSYLVIRRAGDPSTDTQLLTIGPHGGYIAAGYVHYSTTENAGRRQWYVNPFEFFREAFATDGLPKPDTTTLSGRRLFYSHVDGDGWRNLTELPKYRKQRTPSAEVVLEEVIRRFPDLPVTIAPIVGDLDPEWLGNEEQLQLAKRIFALPNVEAGSHTYGHPLAWLAFANPSPRTASADTGFISRIAGWFSGTAAAADAAAAAPRNRGRGSDGADSSRRRSAAAATRSYNHEPFSLELEIDRAITFINRLLPADKRVRVLQWSGDTIPADNAIAASRAAGVRNLNGGDTRFDEEFPSYGWVSPLARQVGSERQVYASNSNENTYTHLWTDRFFGFKYLTATLQNTESPRRVKPHNIYFHMYLGEKLPSLTALIENYRYAQAQELAPTTTSHFAAIVDGFFTTRLVELGPRSWRIEQRDGLQTIRFDDARALSVDYARSIGVIGHRLRDGALYVALDPAVAAPVVTLGDAPTMVPHLVHARWLLSHVRRDGEAFAFRAHGFGPGVAVWKTRPGLTFATEVTLPSGAVIRRRAAASSAGLLTLDLGPATTAPVLVHVRQD